MVNVLVVVVIIQFVAVVFNVEVRFRGLEFGAASLSPMRRWPPLPMHKMSQYPSIDCVVLAMSATLIVVIMVSLSLLNLIGVLWVILSTLYSPTRTATVITS